MSQLLWPLGSLDKALKARCDLRVDGQTLLQPSHGQLRPEWRVPLETHEYDVPCWRPLGIVRTERRLEMNDERLAVHGQSLSWQVAPESRRPRRTAPGRQRVPMNEVAKPQRGKQPGLGQRPGIEKATVRLSMTE